MDDIIWRKRLKKFREERHLTQIELAKLSGVSQAQIAQLEGGGRQFTQKILDRLLKVLRKSYHHLFCPINRSELDEFEKLILQKKRITDNENFKPQKYRKISPKIIHLIEDSKKIV